VSVVTICVGSRPRALLLHAQLAGDRGGLAGVIGLKRAVGDDHVGAGGNRVRHQELEFPGAASPGREPRTVVSLDEQVGTSEIASQAVHRFQRRRQVSEVQPIMFAGRIHVSFPRSLHNRTVTPVITVL
jgi:hypothetical protein